MAMRLLNAHGFPYKKEKSEWILGIIDKIDGRREREDGGAEADGNGRAFGPSSWVTPREA